MDIQGLPGRQLRCHINGSTRCPRARQLEWYCFVISISACDLSFYCWPWQASVSGNSEPAVMLGSGSEGVLRCRAVTDCLSLSTVATMHSPLQLNMDLVCCGSCVKTLATLMNLSSYHLSRETGHYKPSGMTQRPENRQHPVEM